MQCRKEGMRSVGQSRAFIRFDDGRIVRSLYQNTSDVVMVPGTICRSKCVPSRAEIFVDYGYGMWWEGTACLHCGQVIFGAIPYGIQSQTGAVLAPECDIKRGHPDWMKVENEK